MNNAPPMSMPKFLEDRYTMNGKVRVLNRYFNESKSIKKKWSKEYIESFVRTARAKKPGNYGHVDLMLYTLIESFPIRGKSVLITGSFRPFYEGLCIAYGASDIVVSEYNVPECDDDRISYIHVDDLGDRKFDVVLSISSFEHDGLGRYGDPLDPNGDLKAMTSIKQNMKQDSIMFFSVPIGLDTVVWNAHRVYGRVRLPILLDGFSVVWSSFDIKGEADQIIDSEPLQNHLMILRKERDE